MTLRLLGVCATTATVLGALVWSADAFGAASATFAFLAIWLTMVWVTSLSWVLPVRLPAAYRRLRPWERDGRVYRGLGVGVAKWLLRRGPLTVFNPKMRGPHGADPASRARLEQWMSEAEASHGVSFAVGLGVVGLDLARQWWAAAAWALLFDVLVNGYPVALQRYNRAWLARDQA